MERVGNDGVITIEESKGFATELDVVEGMQFDRGYTSPYMVTDSDKMEAVLEKPYILITDKNQQHPRNLTSFRTSCSTRSSNVNHCGRC